MKWVEIGFLNWVAQLWDPWLVLKPVAQVTQLGSTQFAKSFSCGQTLWSPLVPTIFFTKPKLDKLGNRFEYYQQFQKIKFGKPLMKGSQ